MTLKIGRVEFECGPYAIRHRGDELSFRIDVDSETTTDPDVARVMRQQLLGLVNNEDEPVIPVTWDDDPDWDGFYRVRSVQVEPYVVYLSSGLMACDVSLERVAGGFHRPIIETQCIGVTATNDHSQTGYLLQLDSPPGTEWRINTPPGLIDSRDGDVPFTTSNLVSALSTSHSYTVAPGDFYNAAATIKVSAGGSWWPVVGRQIASGTNLVRVENGVGQFDFDLTNAEITFSRWTGAAFGAEQTMSIDGAASFGPVVTESLTLAGLAVIANTPTHVTVACTAEAASGDADTLYLTLHRGYALAYLSVAASEFTGLTVSTGESATADSTHGIYRASDDADGNRWRIHGLDVNALDTSTGTLTETTGVSAAGAKRIAFGVFDDTEHTETVWRGLSFGSRSIRQSVVAR